MINEFFDRLASYGVEYIQRDGHHEIWNESLSQLTYKPIELTSEMIDYQHAYMAEINSEIIDLSFIILSGGKTCGLWLLTASKTDSQWTLTSCGQPVVAPIFFDSTPRKLEKRFCSNAMAFFCNILDLGFKGPLATQQGPVGGGKDVLCTEWYRQAMQHEAIVSVGHDLYVDLTLPLEEIRSHFRKSYKPFINKGLREWNHSIFSSENIDKKSWEEFRNLHKTVSGKVTRGEITWDAQFEMIKSGKAFLVLLRDLKSDKLVGGGFFQYTQDEGIYSVSAFDRSLFDKPLGHVVQQLTIEHMKSMGLRWYRLGERQYLHCDNGVTKKEVDISMFKEGFSTIMRCRLNLILPPSNNS